MGIDLEIVGVFQESLQAIVGTKCWSSIGGEGTGSMFVLAFGDKVSRKVPTTNPHLSEEQKSFEGSIWLHVRACAWRVETDTEVLGAWDVGESSIEAMVDLMGGLVGATVVAATVDLPGLDLTLTFDNGMTLRLFCDQTDLEQEMSNYSMRLGDNVYGVEARSKLEVEPVQAEL